MRWTTFVRAAVMLVAQSAALQSRLDRQLALESTRAAMQEEELHALREKLEAAMAVAVTEAVSDVKAQLGQGKSGRDASLCKKIRSL